MNPSAFAKREWKFSKVAVSQTVSVLGDDLYVCSCFSVPAADGIGFTHNASGTSFPFAKAEQLEDVAWRERLAVEHMGKLADELRWVANTLSVTLAERAEAETQAKKDARASLEAEVGALSW